MSSLAGAWYLVGCLMDLLMPQWYSSSVPKQLSLRPLMRREEPPEGICWAWQCILALFGLWTCRWHLLYVTSPWYNIFLSGVPLLSGIFSSWHMEQCLQNFLQTFTKSSLKLLPLLLPFGLWHSLWRSQHLYHTSHSQ